MPPGPCLGGDSVLFMLLVQRGRIASVGKAAGTIGGAIKRGWFQIRHLSCSQMRDGPNPRRVELPPRDVLIDAAPVHAETETEQ